jgi:hypothetical protein
MQGGLGATCLLNQGAVNFAEAHRSLLASNAPGKLLRVNATTSACSRVSSHRTARQV